MRRTDVLVLGLCLFLTAGCKFVPTASKNEASQGGAAKFDPQEMVADMWEPTVLPYLEKKAGDFSEVTALAREDAEVAGQKFGHKEKQGTSPWTVVVKLNGKIVAANTESRAGSINVDSNGDGKADARIQIGPVMRGTALRDCLDFVTFNDFTNQIDFAQFGKAFNLHVDKNLTSKLPRDGLLGQHVSLLGAYPLVSPDEIPLITPATLKLSDAP